MPSVSPTPRGEINKSYHLGNKAILERVARVRRRAASSRESRRSLPGDEVELITGKLSSRQEHSRKTLDENVLEYG